MKGTHRRYIEMASRTSRIIAKSRRSTPAPPVTSASCKAPINCYTKAGNQPSISNGTADVFPCVLHRVVHRRSAFVRGHPPQPLRDPARAVPLHPGVERARELAERGPGPAPRVVELLLERAEEALRPSVVAAHALAGHAATQAVGLAPRDPRRRPVVHAPVAVDAGALPGEQGPARPLERGVRHGRGGPQADSPVGWPAVEAVYHRVQVDLRAARVPHLGHVGDPQLVGGRGAEVVGVVGAERQARGRRRGLAGVAASPPAAPPPGREPHLAHQPAHDLPAHADAAAAQLRPDGPVAAPAARLEGRLHQRPQLVVARPARARW